jgi:hypothetical protein
MFKVASIEIPEGLSVEEIYSRLFYEPEPSRPDYGWMNPKPRPPHKAEIPKRIIEYRAWIKGGDEV